MTPSPALTILALSSALALALASPLADDGLAPDPAALAAFPLSALNLSAHAAARCNPFRIGSEFQDDLGYNALVFGKLLVQGSRVDHRLFVTGGATVKKSTLGRVLFGGEEDGVAAVTAGGELRMWKTEMVADDAVHYGKAKVGKMTMRHGAEVRKGEKELDFPDRMMDILGAASRIYSTLPTNGEVTRYHDAGVIALASDKCDLVVFNLCADDFKKFPVVRVSVPSSATVLINVAGCRPVLRNVRLESGCGGGALKSDSVVLNFWGASEVRVHDSELDASVLNCGKLVVKKSTVRGQAVNQGMEVRDGTLVMRKFEGAICV